MSVCFQPAALTFLRDLTRNNNREWFEARRSVYEREVKQPMLALIEEINAGLAESAPEHVRAPHKTMLRIHRDTRFSADKRPYKKHVAAWFGRQGAVRTSGPGFYLSVAPAEVQVAMGVFMPLPEQMLAIRRWLAEHHSEYNKLLKQPTRARKDGVPLEPISAQALMRMPKGFPPEHPAGELLRARRWGVQVSWPAYFATEDGFAKRILAEFRRGAGVVRALDGAVDGDAQESARKRARALF